RSAGQQPLRDPGMSAPPLVNATLTKIAGGGSIEDYDAVAGPDTERWSGAAPAYLDDELFTVQSGADVSEVQRSRLVVAVTGGELAQPGDTLTFSYRGHSHDRIVRDLHHFYASLPLSEITLEEE